MTNASADEARRRDKPPSAAPFFRTSLLARLRGYGMIGLALIGGWLYYTVGRVGALYDVTETIERYTDLRSRTAQAQAGLDESEAALDRYTVSGQGYDLSRHQAGRALLRAELGAIRRSSQTEGSRGLLDRVDAAADLYLRAADEAIARFDLGQVAPARADADLRVHPAAERLREPLQELALRFGRSLQLAESRLRESRDAATNALIVLAAGVLVALLLLLRDVNRRILSPCASTAVALGELAGGGVPPRLPELTDDEVGLLARHFNEMATKYADRARRLEERDIQEAINVIFEAAATVNDWKGFRLVLERILEATGASAALLYLPEADGSFRAVHAVGTSLAEGDEAGGQEARRAAERGETILLSVDATTPPINILDGRILPRESAYAPLVNFGSVVGVIALGSATAFTPRAKNALAAIGPSLGVALANTAAIERLAEQSRRLTEQNETLEDQRRRIVQVNRDLQHASAMKDRFLASVSHELRTPMTVILGFTGGLLRGAQGPLTPPQSESLERVQRNAKLLLELINNVLDISKIEAGKMEVKLSPVSLSTIVRQAEADYGEAARKKGIAFRAESAPGLDMVTTDAGKITQLLANLVGNALKFTETGTILVRAEPRGEDQWALIVADTGIGIPEEEQGSVFEEFAQADAPDHKGRGGTGLGLAIVRKLALVLGGSVSLDSAPGRGSRFTVLLPREAAGKREEERPEPERPIAAPDSDARKTVLVVDDDEGVRKLLAFELLPYGVTVLEAADGAAGLAAARIEKPNAILLDVLMPRLDGWETLRLLKEDPETRDIPVVILSVVENRAFGFSLGAFEYMLKPVDHNDLLAILNRLRIIGPNRDVLVVDDEADVRALLEQELEASGYAVRSAAGGAEALDLIEREKPSVVLLDLMMPPPDGFEVLYRIRENPALRDIPVIVITAKELTAEDYRRLNGSAERIVKKGADTTRLIGEVLKSLEKSDAVRSER